MVSRSGKVVHGSRRGYTMHSKSPTYFRSNGRIPLQGAINADNRRYLTAKATRAGHKLDHLMTVLAEDDSVADDRAS